MAYLLQNTLTYTIPLMIVALAGIYAERSGIINLALEGIMIMGAFIGVLVVYIFQKSGAFVKEDAMILMLLALLIAAVVGAVFSLLLAFAAIHLKADQTIGGTALNLLAPALALFLIKIVCNQSTLGMYTGDAASWFMLKKSDFGITGEMNLFQEVFMHKIYPTTYICILLYVVLSIVLYKTKFGLRLRACGENPQAADSLGINVYKMRYTGVIFSGLLGGIGGFAYIAPAVQSWNFEMGVAGMGFLALAVMIFGQWKPFRILFAALFFSLFRAMANIADSIPFLAQLHWPKEIYNMMPFIASMVVLALTSKKRRAPKAEGVPYDKGMR